MQRSVLARRTIVGACVATGLVAAVRLASAQGDDRAIAEVLVSKLAALTSDAVRGPVSAEALARAREALERGTRLRRAGDEAHAKAADGLAREWAETGRDLTRAAEAEAVAVDVRKKAMNEQAQVERTRALVEEGIARVGRLRAQIEEAHRAGDRRRAVELHEGQPRPNGSEGPSRGGRSSTDGGAP